jgi:serine/threonine-protein kinase HipA
LALVIEDDKEESALSINGKKNKLKKKDFDVLASTMQINSKALNSIYTKFNNILPIWINFIHQSFLTKQMQKKYINLLHSKHQNIFQ